MSIDRDVVSGFMDLFAGYSQAHGRYEIRTVNDRGKKEGKAATVNGPATEAIWFDHLHGRGAGVGVIPLRDDNTVSWGAIDIDKYPLDHEALGKTIEKLRLPLVMCRSKSGGAHLFLFLEDPWEAKDVQELLTDWAAMVGYGGCEVFPKQIMRASDRDIGNWLNMPYYHASQTVRYGYVDGKGVDVEDFLRHAYSKRIHFDSIDVSAKAETNDEAGEDDQLAGAPPCLVHLRSQGGFPEGTRNEGMYNIGVYLRKRFPDTWRDQFARYAIEMCSPPLTHSETENLIKSIGKKLYDYRCKHPPINGHCNRKKCVARQYGIGEAGTGERFLEISSITKYEGDPVIWFVEVDGKRIQMGTDELYTQASFHRKCMDVITRCPSAMPAARWQRYLDEKLASADVIQPPKDASPGGQFSILLEQFVQGNAQALTLEEVATRSVPFIDRATGMAVFRSRSLLDYLDRHSFRYKSAHHVYHMLRECGGDTKYRQIGTKGMNVWEVPIPERHLEKEPLPKIGGEAF